MTLLDNAVLPEACANAEAATAVFNAERRFLAVSDRYLTLTGFSSD